ncbi:MAG: glycosyltransferase family 2 protein [Bacteroidia bacterium]|nr:glycosyltransferase family 2 protein [Bacteroidia bacterium]
MSRLTLPDLSIVIPLYNEEEVFHRLVERIDNVLVSLPFAAEVVLIDDGSRDQTATLIKNKCLGDERYQGILLSRNHGHQLALSAGLSNARGTKAIMVMDGDLQDPPELIHDFFNKHLEGFDVVYAIRKKRKENLLKRLAYWSYYRLQRSVSNFEIPIDSGDFGLMSRRVVDQLIAMPEQSRYLRGMRSWVGFKQTGVAYNRDTRVEGTSNYTFKQLMGLAFNGIFNFSEFPIKFITRLGIITILISLVYLAYNIYRKFFIGDVPLGFTALIMAIVLFSGVQLISIGIIGEYVVRIFFQVKNRPLFIVSEKIVDKKEEKPTP